MIACEGVGSACASGKDFGRWHTFIYSRAASTEIVSVEETKRRHIPSKRQWLQLVSELVAHEVFSTLLHPIQKVEVGLRGTSPQMATILHQWSNSRLIKIADSLWWKIAVGTIETTNTLSCLLADRLDVRFP